MSCWLNDGAAHIVYCVIEAAPIKLRGIFCVRERRHCYVRSAAMQEDFGNASQGTTDNILSITVRRNLCLSRSAWGHPGAGGKATIAVPINWLGRRVLSRYCDSKLIA
jgi:hypothetical protein